MDIDPQETVAQATEAKEKSKSRLNVVVAITVALLATFMGICKVKDDNIVQAMQQAQADKLDHWAFYQARNIRQDIAEATVAQLRLAQSGKSPGMAQAYDAEISRYKELATEQAAKKEGLRKQAEQDQRQYDALNFHDDQFDLSDAMLAISIALLAVTALTNMWVLYFLTWIPMSFGVVMGVAGLAGLSIHPDALVKLLS